jgi:predicted Zn-dependent protease
MKLRFLSSNKFKIMEVKAILEPIGVEVVPVASKIEEIQTTDMESLVRDKCEKAFRQIGRPLFVEHTGLYIDSLNGFPGGLTQIFWDTLQADRFSALFGGRPDSSLLARKVLINDTGDNVSATDATFTVANGITTSLDGGSNTVNAGSNDNVWLSGASDIAHAAADTLEVGSGSSATVSGASNKVMEYAGSSANISGGADTVIQNGAGDYAGLLGGLGYVVDASGAGGNVATLANTSLSVSGSDETINLGSGNTLGLLSGSGYSVGASGDTINASADTGLNLSGSSNNLTLAALSSADITGNNNVTHLNSGSDSTVDISGTGNSIYSINSSYSPGSSNNINIYGTDSSVIVYGSYNDYSYNGSNDSVTVVESDIAPGATSEINNFITGTGDNSAEWLSTDFNMANGTSQADNYANIPSGASEVDDFYADANDSGGLTQADTNYTSGGSQATVYDLSGTDIATETADFSGYYGEGDVTSIDDKLDDGSSIQATLQYGSSGQLLDEIDNYYDSADQLVGDEEFNSAGQDIGGSLIDQIDYNYEGGQSVFDAGFGGSSGFAAGVVARKMNVVSQYDLGRETAAAAKVASASWSRSNEAIAASTNSSLAAPSPFNGIKWAQGSTITWSFEDGPTSGPDAVSGAIQAQYQASIEQALQTWSAATGLIFKQVASSAPSDFQIGWGDLNTSTSGMVGYTSYTSLTGNGHPQDLLVRLEDPSQNALAAGFNGALTYTGTNTTLYQAALHEIGHVLGIGETSDPNSIMYPLLGANNATLDATDIAEVDALYKPSGSVSYDGLLANLSPAAASASSLYEPSSFQTRQLAASQLH